MGLLSKGQDGDRGGQVGKSPGATHCLGRGGVGRDSELPVWEAVERNQMKTKKQTNKIQ